MIDGGEGVINVGTFEAGATNDLLALRPSGNNLSPINVSGSVTLGQSLDVAFTNANPTVGHVFTVINKTSAGAVTGTFTNLTEGTTFTVPGIGGDIELQISYNDFLSGTRGENDVALKVLSAPGQGALLLAR